MWPEPVTEFVVACWQVLSQMAPYLLFGFLGAGLFSVLLSPAMVERLVGTPGLGSILKAAGLGVPLPLCSCSVIPVSMALRRHGASPGATTAFLLSTPQTGIDSIAVTYGLLGWPLALFRAVFALVTGVVGGIATEWTVRDSEESTARPPNGESDAVENAAPSWASAPRRFVQYAFVTLPRDIGGPLLVGVLISGLLSVAVPPGELQDYLGSGVVGILAMVALSIPLYVCATASVPIALGLIHMGASPGAALAFLIAGPATNSATVLAVLKVLGRRAMTVYLTTVAVAAIAAGVLFDGFIAGSGEPASIVHSHSMIAAPSWAAQAAAVFLLALLVVMNPRVHKLIRWAVPVPPPAEAARSGNEAVLRVTGMTCAHCEQTLEKALRSCSGVGHVSVNRLENSAVVRGKELQFGELLEATRVAGFSARIESVESDHC